jgi:GNAT superfamily N-acetyltransferase
VIYEIIGYAASVLVAVSLTMGSILRLRIINLAGAALFAVYGVLIGAAPVAAVNTFIVGVNIYYLYRIFGTKEFFRVLETGARSEFLEYFLELNRADIDRNIPEFTGRVREGDLSFFILRGAVPAGLVIGEPKPDGTLDIRLDYVLPGYRDFKVGEFLYQERAGFFRDKGISRLRARASTREHRRYLERMGFEFAVDGTYQRTVPAAATGAP